MTLPERQPKSDRGAASATVLYRPTEDRPHLHLGCGKDIREGFLNVDSVALPGVDAVVDLNRAPWPFATAAWSRVEAHHVLEHLEDVVGAMRELHRILAPGGVARLSVPHMAGWGAWSDLTHRHWFNRLSFLNFEKGHPFNYYYDFGFSSVRSRNAFGVGRSACLNGLMNPLVNTALYDWLLWKIVPSAEVQVTLVK